MSLSLMAAPAQVPAGSLTTVAVCGVLYLAVAVTLTVLGYALHSARPTRARAAVALLAPIWPALVIPALIVALWTYRPRRTLIFERADGQVI